MKVKCAVGRRRERELREIGLSSGQYIKSESKADPSTMLPNYHGDGRSTCQVTGLCVEPSIGQPRSV